MPSLAVLCGGSDLNLDVHGGRHVAGRNGLVDGLAQLIHALTGEVDLGAELIGLGIDHGTEVVHGRADLLGTLLIEVAGVIPRVVGHIARHRTGLRTRTRGGEDADNRTGGGADDGTSNKAERLTHVDPFREIHIYRCASLYPHSAAWSRCAR